MQGNLHFHGTVCRVLWNTEGEQCARSSALAGLSVQGGLGPDSCAGYYGLAGQSMQGGMEGSLHLQYAQYEQCAG